MSQVWHCLYRILIGLYTSAYPLLLVLEDSMLKLSVLDQLPYVFLPLGQVIEYLSAAISGL